MRIGALYSHLSGYEWLLHHKRELWQEIENVVGSIDASQFLTKESKEERKLGKLLYSPSALNAEFKTQFSSVGWRESRVSYYVTADIAVARTTIGETPRRQREIIEGEGSEAIPSYNQTDFLKDRVAIEVQFGKYAFVAYDLFVKHMAFFTQGEIDCGVEILPMKSMQRHMSSGPSYYEGEVYNVVRQGRSAPPMPLVVIGLEP